METPDDELQKAIPRIGCRHDTGHSCHDSGEPAGNRRARRPASELTLSHRRLRCESDAPAYLLLWESALPKAARRRVRGSAVVRWMVRLPWLCRTGRAPMVIRLDACA